MWYLRMYSHRISSVNLFVCLLICSAVCPTNLSRLCVFHVICFMWLVIWSARFCSLNSRLFSAFTRQHRGVVILIVVVVIVVIVAPRCAVLCCAVRMSFLYARCSILYRWLMHSVWCTCCIRMVPRLEGVLTAVGMSDFSMLVICVESHVLPLATFLRHANAYRAINVYYVVRTAGDVLEMWNSFVDRNNYTYKNSSAFCQLKTHCK